MPLKVGITGGIGSGKTTVINIFKTLPDYILNKTKIVVLSVYQKQEDVDRLFENSFVAGQLDKPLTQESLRTLKTWKEQPALANRPARRSPARQARRLRARRLR